MKSHKTKFILMISFLIICSLCYKIDCYAKQISKLNTELIETHNYYKSTINNIEQQYEKEITDYLYERDKEIYGEQFEDKILSEIVGFNIQKINEVNKSKWYYYNKLDEEQKRVYEELLVNVIKQQSHTFRISGFTQEDIWNFIKYIQYDHERIFWIDWNAPDSMKYNPNTEEFIFNGQAYKNFTNLDEIYNAWKEIENYKEKALGSIEQLRKEQIEMQIYNYIVMHTQYNLEAPMAQSLYSTVLGETVCTGYSKMFKYLCNEAGIDCISIFGKCKANNENHLWNIVEMNGQTYMTDCVPALMKSSNGEIYISYSTLNSSLDYMNRNYMVNQYFEISK